MTSSGRETLQGLSLVEGLPREPFRPIYYLGSKASMAPLIAAAIDDIDPSHGRVLDLFAGSGSVSSYLSATREVVAVDIQEYSRVLCSAMLRPAAISAAKRRELLQAAFDGDVLRRTEDCLTPMIAYERACIERAGSGDSQSMVEFLEAPPLAAHVDEEDWRGSGLDELLRSSIANLRAAGLWDHRATTVTRNFGGTYFSYRQAIELDGILEAAALAPQDLSDMLTAAALSTASQIVNTVGKQFAQPIRPRNRLGVTKPGLARLVRRDRTADVPAVYSVWLDRYLALPGGRAASKAIRADYHAALTEEGPECTAIYADPPYTRDHYSRFYHVLETMCLRDGSAISSTNLAGKRRPSRGVYRSERYQSPFCIRSAAPRAFEQLFRTAAESRLPLVVSYSPHETGDGTHPRVVSTTVITEIARSCYRRVDVLPVSGIVHNKLNRSGLELDARDFSELLIKCFN